MPAPSHLTAEELLSPRLEQRILPGLERVRAALTELGQPQRRFPSVLIVGTNGKGSTAALLAGILAAAGARVGLYTSPHLVHIEERIQVDGTPIPSGRLRDLVADLERFPSLSYFETLTVAAFLEFAAQGVDLAVVEAGLGGRWDAAATCEPVVSMLTNVGTDHQRWLGTTRAAIAAEKAAALSGSVAIVGDWDDEVEPAIRREASAPIVLASQWARVEPVHPEEGGEGRRRIGVAVGSVAGEMVLPLVGPHQLRNAALALAGAQALANCGLIPPLSRDVVAEGLARVRWPGRWQWLATPAHRLLLDGAHNREAMLALVTTLDAEGLSGKVNLVFSCLDDKPLQDMAHLLIPRVRRVVVAPLNSPRATDLFTLAAAFPGCTTAPSTAQALTILSHQPDPALVTGSLRLVGEALAWAASSHV